MAPHLGQSTSRYTGCATGGRYFGVGLESVQELVGVDPGLLDELQDEPLVEILAGMVRNGDNQARRIGEVDVAARLALGDEPEISQATSDLAERDGAQPFRCHARFRSRR